MKSSQHLYQLINKYKSNEATAAELELLQDYLADDLYKEIIQEVLQDSLLEDVDVEIVEDVDFQNELDFVFKKIKETQANQVHSIRKNRVNYGYIVKIAAAILCVFSLGLIVHYYVNDNKEEVQAVASQDVLPGWNQAFLGIDGKNRVELADNDAGIVVSDQSISYSNGESIQGLALNQSQQKSVELVLEVPRKGKYKVQLSDGTLVWLNSDSKLKYPSVFEGEVRKVELEGEAYFEVSSALSANNKPFIVNSRGQEIKVLGTHFNVQAYSDESETVTSLLEGSVQVRSIIANSSLLLSSGQASFYNHNQQSLAKKSMDVSQSIGWKEGLFILRGQKLGDIMRQIARWYDVEVKYLDSAPLELQLGGVISHSNSLKEVLHAISQTSAVSFQINGKTVIVQ